MTAQTPVDLLRRIQREFKLLRAGELFWLVAGSFLIMCFELAGVSALMPLANMIITPDASLQSPYYQELMTVLNLHTAQELVVALGCGIALVFIAKGILNILYWRYEFKTLSRWRHIITDRLYRLYLGRDYLHFIATPSVRIIGAITESVPVITNNFIHQFIALFNNILMGVLLLGFMLSLNVAIFALLLATGLILVLSHKFFQARASTRLASEIMELTDEQAGLLRNSIAGYKETKLHNMEERFATRYLNTAAELSRKDMDLLFIRNLPVITVEMAVMILIIVIFVSTAFFTQSMGAIAAYMGVLVILSLRMIPIINRIIASATLIKTSRPMLESLLADIDASQNKSEATNDVPVSIPDVSNRFTVDLNIKRFAYPGQGEAALRDIHLAIDQGAFIGLTGPSGGGKSSLIHILTGFIHGYDGHYTINGVAVDHASIASLRHVLGFVDQQIFVMEGTIAENVAFGHEGDEIDRARVQNALEKAQLWPFVSGLAQDMDTKVGENGNLLSGGQKQRLAIARSFYRDARLLVLDEASAALDVETEREFFDYLATLKGTISVVMIAHRLSTLKSCDRILFMENGAVSAQGDFNSLYKSNETFKRYVDYSNIDIQD